MFRVIYRHSNFSYHTNFVSNFDKMLSLLNFGSKILYKIFDQYCFYSDLKIQKIHQQKFSLAGTLELFISLKMLRYCDNAVNKHQCTKWSVVPWYSIMIIKCFAFYLFLYVSIKEYLYILNFDCITVICIYFDTSIKAYLSRIII